MIVSLFKNLKSPEVRAQLDIQSVMDIIKNGLFKEQIEALRSLGRTHLHYDKTKTSIPTFTPHACFNQDRNLEYLKGLSGLIYFDIDNNIDPELLNQHPFVYAYWNSIGGVGHSVLVKVDHLTVNNFHRTWDNIANRFADNGLTFDPGTWNLAVQNIISYDPDLHVNSSCIPLDACLIYPIMNEVEILKK